MARSSDKSDPLPRREKRALGLIALCAIIMFFGGLALAAYAALNYRYETRPKTPEAAVIFNVPKGSGLSSIATNLEKSELISSAFVFKAVTKLRGGEAAFKAGEYAVPGNATMAEVFDILSSGRSVQYPFTAPEGLTSAMITRSLDAIETLIDDNPSVPAEGSLLPETYLTPRGMKQSELLRQMANAQDRLINDLWEKRAEDLPIKTKEEAIILASVVEKETGIGAERDKVAGVFINRLNKGMRLQSDPTIIYGVSKGEVLRNRRGERRGIYRSEIDRKTDWNTYQIDGLPKTPICNPGAEAIRAVLDPAETDALFFVADGTGGHVFSKTLAEHNRNVKQWRKIERARKRANEKKKVELRR